MTLVSTHVRVRPTVRETAIERATRLRRLELRYQRALRAELDAIDASSAPIQTELECDRCWLLADLADQARRALARARRAG